MTEETKLNDDTKILDEIGDYKYGFHDRDDNYVFKSERGLSREVVENISRMKGEPQWMLEFRLKALEHYLDTPHADLGTFARRDSTLTIFFITSSRPRKAKNHWDDVPDDIKNTFDKLGIPEAEQKFLAGVGAQYESEMVYHSILEHLEKQGVIFLSIEDGLKQYPDLFREYFGTVIPIEDNKFAALNSAVWSGGSFVYVPKGVKVDLPLQAYFRLNTANVGQFERTLIIVDEGASVHYVEGCTAPQYTTNSFHSGVIEIIVKKGARSRYSTIQNWSTNVFNLVTQRAKVFAERLARMGGCESRLEAHDEISILLFDGTRRARRNAFHGICRPRSDPGCGLEDDAFCSEHNQQDHVQVHQQGRRTRLLSRHGQSV